MPFDYLMLNEEISKIINQKSQEENHVPDQTKNVIAFFITEKLDPKVLISKINKITSVDSGERCALPFETPVSNVVEPNEISPSQFSIIASDGSQIVPDYHAGLDLAVINAACYIKNPRRTPLEVIQSKVYDLNSLDFDKSIKIESVVSLIRDVTERLMILGNIEKAESRPCLCLFDGPIELWHEPRKELKLKGLFDNYICTLQKISSMNGILAGYIDQPRSTFVVRMLELATLPDNRISESRSFHPYSNISDLDLFKNILGSGQRSAVFAVQSTSLNEYPDDVSIFFFYLNVGKTSPAIVRVEIPKNVAISSDLVDIVHTTLLKECECLGNVYYPYSLLRAHELAILTNADRTEVITRVNNERLSHGLQRLKPSQKQAAKLLLPK